MPVVLNENLSICSILCCYLVCSDSFHFHLNLRIEIVFAGVWVKKITIRINAIYWLHYVSKSLGQEIISIFSFSSSFFSLTHNFMGYYCRWCSHSLYNSIITSLQSGSLALKSLYINLVSLHLMDSLVQRCLSVFFSCFFFLFTKVLYETCFSHFSLNVAAVMTTGDLWKQSHIVMYSWGESSRTFW